MKMNGWMIFGMMVATSLLAQPVADPPPAAAQKAKAETTAAKPAKKAAPAEKKPAVAEKPIVLVPGPATITGDKVNVRGKASFVGEIIARLNKGDAVKVIEQVIREKPKADEPSQWAKIGYPTNAHVWVHATYIDASNKVVLPKRLNVRAGPGENYSIVGLVEKGSPVKEVSVKGNWLEIEAPAEAYAFVAARYLKQEGPEAAVPPVVSIAPPIAEPPTTTPVIEPPPVAPPDTNVVASTTPAEPPGITPTPEAADAPPPPAEEPLPPRVVSHEGVVKYTVSIQAPTTLALVSPDTGRTINYLYTTSTNLDLNLYKGRHIIVTGEEGLDKRWKNTPVITIQRIQVLD
jgi:uncharacterized protein YgiM (DUF1202 family)